MTSIPSIPAWVTDMFARLDAGDTNGWLAYLAEDVEFRLGSAPVVRGRQAVKERIMAMSLPMTHTLREVCELPEVTFVVGEAHIVGPGDRPVTLPFIDRFQRRSEQILRYETYLDPTPLRG